jgi:DNA-binding NarL/FixJ family response regulator
MYVCHHCDNPPCVNSDHLFAGTAKQNMQDCKAKGRLVVDALVNRDRFGEANGCAKLTKKDVMWARSNGLTNGETAYRLGVSHTTISKIRSRKIWASF